MAPANSPPPVFGRDRPWLAPLAGYSDLPFRLLCREYGAAVCVTEMVSAKGLIYQSPGSGELLQSAPEDQPLVVQLFGAEATILAQALRLLRQHGYSAFDLNMGCSVPKVLRQGAGAALLGDPAKTLGIARAMLEAARSMDFHSSPAQLGFKLRLGLSPDKNILPDLALRLEDAGASWICLHPRYACQGFGGSATWEEIARLAPRLNIPLIASGDLFTARDGLRCIQETGAGTVLYARGALRNPAIFRAHLLLCRGEEVSTASRGELSGMILRHLSLIRQAGGEDAALWKMRSIVPRYVRGLAGVRLLRERLCRCTDWTELENLLQNFLAQEDP